MEKGPQMPTPAEMAEISKKRILSDAELVKEGAEVTPDGKIISASEKQIREAKGEIKISDLSTEDWRVIVDNMEKFPSSDSELDNLIILEEDLDRLRQLNSEHWDGDGRRVHLGKEEGEKNYEEIKEVLKKMGIEK
jgi:hypothetical protein